MPNGQFPTVLAGQPLTAGLVQSLAAWWAWKAADTPRSNTTTLANDPDLSIPVGANQVWHIFGWIYATGAAISTADIKLTFTGPSGATGAWDGLGYATSGTTITGGNPVSGAGLASARAFGVNSSSFSPVRLDLFMQTSSTAGSATLQWAQNTSNATQTILKTGSRLIALRVQ